MNNSNLTSGTVQGTLNVAGQSIALKYAYAHMHDNAEGFLDRPRELRILLTDTEVPEGALNGIVFLPVEDLAHQRALKGVLIKLDPAKPDEIYMTPLTPPSESGLSMTVHTLNTPGSPAIKDFQLSADHASGALEYTAESFGNSGSPATVISLKFSAPIANEPAVTLDVQNEAAANTPQAKAFAARANAFASADFASVKQLSTESSYRRMDEFLKTQPDQVAAMAKEAGAEMQKQIALIQRVVARGDRAVIIFSQNCGWANFVLQDNAWKCND